MLKRCSLVIDGDIAFVQLKYTFAKKAMLKWAIIRQRELSLKADLLGLTIIEAKIDFWELSYYNQ